MTDIVERLRAYGGDEMLHQSAADEIDRLRAALQKIAMNKLESRAKLEDIARRALEPKP